MIEYIPSNFEDGPMRNPELNKKFLEVIALHAGEETFEFKFGAIVYRASRETLNNAVLVDCFEAQDGTLYSLYLA